MAKEFFQDIVPPSHGNERPRAAHSRRVKPEPMAEEPLAPTPHDDDEVTIPHEHEDHHDEYNHDAVFGEPTPSQTPPQPRGIRDISIARQGRAARTPSESYTPPSRDPHTATAHRRSRGGRFWIVIVGLLCIAAVGILVALSLRPTTITVTPRSQDITFASDTIFVATPDTMAATGTLAYITQTIDLEDSAIIAAQSGTTHVETKASGSITVYNDYSTDPVRLIATTRFETPDHLIYRTPTDIVIPGKKGSVPGQVNVTIVADQAGAQYNSVATATRLTVPGLQSNAAMYAGVYAQTAAPITGGFVGEQAATDPAERSAAIASLRTRLLEAVVTQAREQAGEERVVLPGLIQATYQSLPDTTEENGVGLHESIHALVPTLPAEQFAREAAVNVIADTGNTPLRLVGGVGFGAVPMDIASSTVGSTPIRFSLTGAATIVWMVDAQALATAVAGKDLAAFKSIAANFPGVAEAKGRVEPIWSKTFPSDPSAIHVIVTDPATTPKP